MADENITAKKNHLKAESEYRVTLAKMEGMKKRLSLLKINTDAISAQNLVSSISIYAPAGGYITEVLAMKGMFLTPTDVAVEIVNTDHIHVSLLRVFEKDILKLKKGQMVEFRIPDASPDVYKAKVHLISKQVDEENRIVEVHAHLENEKDKARLIAGMFVEAEIVMEENKVKGILESAIVSEEEEDFVLIHNGKKENNYTFTKRAITVGQRKNGFAQIINANDFTGTESILTKGAFNLIGIE